MGGYRFLEDVVIADVAFEAWGEDPSDLFEACAKATFEVMVDLDHVKPLQSFQIELSSETLDGLLFDWLAELVFLKDSRAMVFNRFEVKVDQVDAHFTLKATVSGEPIDAEKLPMRLDVKAPTLHMFEVGRRNGGWKARIVLDV
jgi:SHS2 domain-containing protein